MAAQHLLKATLKLGTTGVTVAHPPLPAFHFDLAVIYLYLQKVDIINSECMFIVGLHLLTTQRRVRKLQREKNQTEIGYES